MIAFLRRGGDRDTEDAAKIEDHIVEQRGGNGEPDVTILL